MTRRERQQRALQRRERDFDIYQKRRELNQLKNHKDVILDHKFKKAESDCKNLRRKLGLTGSGS